MDLPAELTRRPTDLLVISALFSGSGCAMPIGSSFLPFFSNICATCWSMTMTHVRGALYGRSSGGFEKPFKSSCILPVVFIIVLPIYIQEYHEYARLPPHACGECLAPAFPHRVSAVGPR